MARVPFIGRLYWREYLALLGSIVLVFLESIISIITLGLPQPVIRFCYNQSKKLFNTLSSPNSKSARAKRKGVSHSIATAADFTDLCSLWGYYAEEHIVQTGDGYLLGLHRLAYKKIEDPGAVRVNAGQGSLAKPVVYLHHGLLMNSEVWVCISEEERNLPFALVERGYDVWLGNNRGNKYSKKSTRFSPSSSEFWNFSMDQFAFHDIPDSIDYIIETTSQPNVSYIGFSQGTAQAFATLSIHPTLNDKINCFIALAPAMSPAGVSNRIVDALVKASPDVLFLAFGRKSILSSATMWQSILYPPIFVRLIDMSLTFLFNWTGKNISPHQKLAAYPHLYSFTSTKSVVHWFQIIRNKSFQMYDDDTSNAMSIGASNYYYKVAKFPTKNIKTPIVLVYGGSDSLVDIKVMLKELPRHTYAQEIKHFEHLDFLWAQDVDKLVFPHVFDALGFYSNAAQVYDQSRPRVLQLARSAHRRSGSNTSNITNDDDNSDYEGVNDIRSPARKSFAQAVRERQYSNSTHTPMKSIDYEPSRPSSSIATPNGRKSPDESYRPTPGHIATPSSSTATANGGSLREQYRSTSPTHYDSGGDSNSINGGRNGSVSGNGNGPPRFGVGLGGINIGKSRPTTTNSIGGGDSDRDSGEGGSRKSS